MSDSVLIKKCQRGDKAAFEELIRLYYPYVSRFLIRVTGDETLTEDLTQDVFLKMIRNIERYDPERKAGFGTWLIAIAKNCYIDYLRRNRIHIEDIDSVPLADNSDISESIQKKLEYEQLLKMIETLPKEQGLAIRLKYEEDMTLAEIAEKFGVPSKTIKSRIHDGKVKLRKLLKTGERSDEL